MQHAPPAAIRIKVGMLHVPLVAMAGIAQLIVIKGTHEKHSNCTG
jgi:hypothetical protein